MRYLPLTESERTEMLEVIGVNSVEELFADIPASVLSKTIEENKNLPSGKGEIEVEKYFTKLAMNNLSTDCSLSFLGAGAYKHHIPASVDYLIQRGEFLTAYTPYQPEVSQGTLQVIYEFQTQIALMTGMEVANASMYDGATACAEAVAMACRATKKSKAILSGGLHPHYVDVTKSFVQFVNVECDILPPNPQNLEDLVGRVNSDTACVVVQYPDFFGNINNYQALANECKANNCLLVVVVTEPLALGLLKTPGEFGADIVVGDGGSLASGLSFGGPTVGFFATNKKYLRTMPGRLVGETKDVDGKRGFVLTLATREQHIRREKATSNICTNSGLMATAFSIHMGLLGDSGFEKLAETNHYKAVKLKEELSKIEEIKILNSSFFNEFTVMLNKPADEVVDILAQKNILCGVPVSRLYPSYSEMKKLLLVAITEMNSDEDIKTLCSELKEVLK